MKLAILGNALPPKDQSITERTAATRYDHSPNQPEKTSRATCRMRFGRNAIRLEADWQVLVLSI